MGRKMSRTDIALFRATDEVLHYIWDPIGIAGEPGARDEYSSYLPVVFAFLKEGRTEEQIANYLDGIVSEHMGMQPDHESSQKIATILMNWKGSIEAPEINK